MKKPFDVREQLATFAGTAPLFPLPNIVHFPHLLLPLRIFEPRYLDLVQTALAGDRLIAMALLRPGWTTTAGSPPIYETVCLGRISAEQQMPDGRYYLVLQGLSRAQIISEPCSGRAYRVAELELRPDEEGSLSANAADAHRRRLIGAFRKLFPRHDLDKVLRRAIEERVPLGVLCDVLADAMSLDPHLGQKVLSEFDINRRAALVMRLIQQKLRCRPSAVPAGWPPTFSLN